MKEKTLKTKGVEWTIGNYNRMNVLEGEEKRGYVQFTFESSEEGELKDVWEMFTTFPYNIDYHDAVNEAAEELGCDVDEVSVIGISVMVEIYPERLALGEEESPFGETTISLVVEEGIGVRDLATTEIADSEEFDNAALEVVKNEGK